jgi:hypothetical protein
VAELTKRNRPAVLMHALITIAELLTRGLTIKRKPPATGSPLALIINAF